MKRQLDPIAESSILLKEKCSEIINLPASPQKLQELDRLHRYASSFAAHLERREVNRMDTVESTITEMRKKQFYWQNYSAMQNLTISEMMALERWLCVAEMAPNLVALSK